MKRLTLTLATLALLAVPLTALAVETTVSVVTATCGANQLVLDVSHDEPGHRIVIVDGDGVTTTLVGNGTVTLDLDAGPWSWVTFGEDDESGRWPKDNGIIEEAPECPTPSTTTTVVTVPSSSTSTPATTGPSAPPPDVPETTPSAPTSNPGNDAPPSTLPPPRHTPPTDDRIIDVPGAPSTTLAPVKPPIERLPYTGQGEFLAVLGGLLVVFGTVALAGVRGRR